MTVRAAVMTGPDQPIEVREFPRPALEPGEVLFDTLYSEVCGTDCHLFHGRLAGVPYPIIPGHVSVGRIAETSGVVRDVHGRRLGEGEIVGFLDVHGTCGACWYCLVAKASTRCPERRVYGITYSANEGLLGGWSECIHLRAGVRIVPLPEAVTPVCYIAGGCGLPTAFHAVERGDMRMGDTVVVQGAGPVGLCAAALAKLSGAARVVAIGAPELRLALARKLGADETLDLATTTPESRLERVQHLTGGRGADVVIEASGNPRAVLEGIGLARDCGTYVIVGQYTDNGTVEINPHEVNRKHLDVRGCWGTDFSHLYRAVEILDATAGRLPWEAMISRVYSLGECGDALADVEALRVVKAVIAPTRLEG